MLTQIGTNFHDMMYKVQIVYNLLLFLADYILKLPTLIWWKITEMYLNKKWIALDVFILI